MNLEEKILSELLWREQLILKFRIDLTPPEVEKLNATLDGMVAKGFLSREIGGYRLTEKGYSIIWSE